MQLEKDEFEEKNVVDTVSVPKVNREELKVIRREYGVHNPKVFFYVREMLPDKFVTVKDYAKFLEEAVKYISFGAGRVSAYLRFLHARGEASCRKINGKYLYKRRKKK